MTDTSRNYVAAWIDRKTDSIIVLERDSQGNAHRVRYNSPYYFFIPDEEGDYTSIFGDKLIRAEFDSKEEYKHAKEAFRGTRLFESDISPLKRILMDVYHDRPTPIVNYAFLDIEVNYFQAGGFPSPTNPYADINAISIYQSWTGKYLSLVVPPPEWTGTVKDLYSEIDRQIEQKNLRAGIIPEITICKDEMELLIRMCEALEHADILSGWNSEFFDIPYICERLLVNAGTNSLGEPNKHLLRKLEYVGVDPPEKEMINRYGTEEPTYTFKGKTHLDYMDLFKKFTFEGRTSYSLGNILQEEVDVGKIEYDGTLEELYKNNFSLFTAYNFRDTDGIVQLNEKFKFIAIVNQMAHENTVNFGAMLGTVAYVETGLTNHAHNVLKRIVHDKNIVEHDKVEGAIVLTPTPAVHEMIGSVDLKSQYPNTIRSLNISPEMIRGQFGDISQDDTTGEKAWRDIRAGNENRHTLFIEGTNEQIIHTAEEWRWILLEKKWAVSAYGTVFDQGNGPGIVAEVVGFWYNERKRLQKEKKKWGKMAQELKNTLGRELSPEELLELK